MAAIRALIVDDEPLAREGVRMLLASDPEVEIAGETANGRETVAAIRRLKPDLVVLDVQMPEMNGLEVLRAIAPHPLPAVIFVTAWDRYALDAFEVHAVDYLLKPFGDDRFRDALDRAKRQLKLAKVGELSKRLAELLDGRPAKPEEFARRIAIREVGRVLFLDVDEIDWIEAADYYVQLHVGSKSYLHRETMQALEKRLDPRRFARVHRSAIVNVQRVRELRAEGRDAIAVLHSGTELRVSRRYRDRLEEAR